MSARAFNSRVGGGPFNAIDAAWIPVHFMAKDSGAKSVAILRDGKFSAIAANFSSSDFSKQSGAISPVKPTLEELQQLDKANKIWQELTNTPGTPMIVYKDRVGGAHVHLGYTQTSILEEIVAGAPSARLRNYDIKGAASGK